MNESCHERVLAHVWMSPATRWMSLTHSWQYRTNSWHEWVFHMYETFVTRDSFVTATHSWQCLVWTSRSWHVTHSYGVAWKIHGTSWHTSWFFLCVTWLIYTCDMFCVWHDSFTPVTWLLICYSYEKITMCDMTCVVFIWDTVTNESLSRKSHVSRMTHTYEALIRVIATRHVAHTKESWCVTWHDACGRDVTHLYVSFVCGKTPYEMTHSCVSFVSFVCNQTDAYGRVSPFVWGIKESCHIRDDSFTCVIVDSFMCVIRTWQDL